MKAEGRDPRLVLDSTICQVSPLCQEAVMPTVQEIRRSFSLRTRGHSHSRLILRQLKSRHRVGPTAFCINSILWRYVVCHFRAKFSAYWWQRVGGLSTRILHSLATLHKHKINLDVYSFSPKKTDF